MFYRQGLKGGICKRGRKERCFWVLLRHLFVAFPSGARGKRIERKKKGNTLSFWAFFLLLLLSRQGMEWLKRSRCALPCTWSQEIISHPQKRTNMSTPTLNIIAISRVLQHWLTLWRCPRKIIHPFSPCWNSMTKKNSLPKKSQPFSVVLTTLKMVVRIVC